MKSVKSVLATERIWKHIEKKNYKTKKLRSRKEINDFHFLFVRENSLSLLHFSAFQHTCFAVEG